jgi:SAM-dependent methyltransferase
MFAGASLEIEDLYLLESFQIAYLPGWIPEQDLGVVLNQRPDIGRCLRKRNPGSAEFLNRVESTASEEIAKKDFDQCCDAVVWTIADLLIYNKFPEMYDRLSFHGWDFGEVTGITELVDKVVVDGGSGTGRVALEAAQTAGIVYAVEPVGQLRQFIREKASLCKINNLYVVDGFLHCLPFPNGSVDVLITSHALGWRLENELSEFERIVRPSGFVIHCPGTAEVDGEDAQHQRLISPDWGYNFSRYEETDGWKRKYWKIV